MLIKVLRGDHKNIACQLSHITIVHCYFWYGKIVLCYLNLYWDYFVDVIYAHENNNTLLIFVQILYKSCNFTFSISENLAESRYPRVQQDLASISSVEKMVKEYSFRLF